MNGLADAPSIDIIGDDYQLVEVAILPDEPLPAVGTVTQIVTWNGRTYRLCVHAISDVMRDGFEVATGRPGDMFWSAPYRLLTGHELDE